MKSSNRLYSHVIKAYFRIKGMGIFALVPLLILYILLPLTNYVCYRYFMDMDILYSNIVESCNRLIPLFSVWHVFFIMYHLVEEPGNEILYTSDRSKLGDLFPPYIAYCILLLPLFFVYTSLFPDLWWLYLRLLAINLTYLTFVYCTSFLFANISVSIIAILIYTIAVAGTAANPYIYKNAQQAGGDFLFQHVLPYILSAIFFALVGILMNRFFTKYK